MAQADVLWRPLVWGTFGRRPEADLRLQASDDDHTMDVATSASTSWLALYHRLVALALPVQAALNGKVRPRLNRTTEAWGVGADRVW